MYIKNTFPLFFLSLALSHRVQGKRGIHTTCNLFCLFLNYVYILNMYICDLKVTCLFKWLTNEETKAVMSRACQTPNWMAYR